MKGQAGPLREAQRAHRGLRRGQLEAVSEAGGPDTRAKNKQSDVFQGS